MSGIGLLLVVIGLGLIVTTYTQSTGAVIKAITS